MSLHMGTVIWFKKNYGFIKWTIEGEPQKDLFVHYSDLTMSGFKILKAGQLVSFNIGKNHNQQLKAIDVVVIK